MSLFWRTDYVKRVETALAKEDAALLEVCLSIDPQVIPGGDHLLEAGLSNVRTLLALSV